jgi:S-adenosylmethionine hydrolase
VDHFGNLVTNIRQATLARHLGAPLDDVEVRIHRQAVHGVEGLLGNHLRMGARHFLYPGAAAR